MHSSKTSNWALGLYQCLPLLDSSATWPEGVRRLAQSYMVNPIQVFVGSLDLAAVHSVTQRIEFIEDENKLERVSGQWMLLWSGRSYLS
jgi:superfamily II DNA/RNA helicase